ncbi:MAG: SPRY domain-containing protein [Thermodesulfobacteriota bacterium]
MKKLAGTSACYNARNSLLLDSSLSQYLSRTLSVSGDRRKWTWSGWIKRAKLSAVQDIFSAWGDAGGNGNIYFLANDNLAVYEYSVEAGATTYNCETAAVFRDVAAHYHIHIIFDSTQATASERIRVYINNVRQLFSTAAVYPTLNFECYNINSSAKTHTMGQVSSATMGRPDHYLSEVNFIGGLAVEPSATGYYCPLTGQWIPKKYKGSFGTNGCYLEFLDAAQLGKDTSGNGNHWTTYGGIVAANQTADTPTNNHCVLNPLDADNYDVVTPAWATGNLRFTASGTGATASHSRGSMPTSAGRLYWEATIVTAGPTHPIIGLMAASGENNTSGSYFGPSLPTSIGYRADGTKTVANVASPYGAAFTSGAVIGVALDLISLMIEFQKNGVSQGTIALPAGTYVPAVSGYDGSIVDLNFGQRPFTYPPPAGFKSPCAANLLRPAQRAQNVFAAITAPGSSIETTLAAARPWASYIEIFKDRSNTQSWKWRFSDDLPNMLSSDSQAGKTAFTAPTAADNYVGYALRVGAAYGVFTTEVAHVNGTPTNVAHGLGTNRLMAIGKIVNTTGDWPVWHPELAANQYLLLNSTAAAADGPKITVDTTNVILAASLPSGTYRVIAIAETSGCIKMGKHTGIGAADGPFVYAGGCPSAELIKRTDIAGNSWLVLDERRPGYNVTNSTLEMDTANAETLLSANALDLVSNGSKIRDTGAGVNASGGTYIYVAIAAAPLKYANAK